MEHALGLARGPRREQQVAEGGGRHPRGGEGRGNGTGVGGESLTGLVVDEDSRVRPLHHAERAPEAPPLEEHKVRCTGHEELRSS